ncbi:MAG: methyltransferase domain-containing protein [Salinivenus sp.]
MLSRSRLLLVTVLLIGLGPLLGNGCADAPRQAPPPFDTAEADVPYVATSEAAVTRMLEIAEVGPGDVVYDLGSGDGRIVITAAQRYGARGVGVEIDPYRVYQARKNAERAGVADRVTFREQDLFEADVSDATVVTLYLLPAINKKLRPLLLEQLDPGTRVVSHNFGMGDWAPDSTERVGPSTVYRWTIPETIPDTLRTP